MKFTCRATLLTALFALALPGAGRAQTQMASASSPPPVGPSTGSIEGVVTMSSRLTEGRMRFRPYGDYGQGQFPAEAEDAVDHFANVVVYLVSTQLVSSASPSGETAEISQSRELFAPKVLPVIRGTTVEFPNDDEIYHNVFSLSAVSSFDLGRYPRGESRSVILDEAGVVKVFCHIHSDMTATVLVLDNPYFAKPDAEGRFTIEGVPPGEHTVVLWHERMRPIEFGVVVSVGEVVSLEAHLPFSDESANH